MIDFTDCKEDLGRAYGGANGNKIGIVYNGINYMLKFPPKPTINQKISYTNSCFSEYIACHIFDNLGMKTQETLLGRYGDKVVVACKDFEEDGRYKFMDFASVKNTVLKNESNGYGTELEELLSTMEEQKRINSEELKEFFWDMFIVDAFLGNFDRHNGNWGFLYNKEDSEFTIAPVFDCGSCLFPQNSEEDMEKSLRDNKKMEERLYSYPRSAIKIYDVKINYYSFLTTTDSKDCLRSLKKIVQKINLNEINGIIDKTPYITDIHKNFIKIILKERKEKILDRALEINRNIAIEL